MSEKNTKSELHSNLIVLWFYKLWDEMKKYNCAYEAAMDLMIIY